MHGVRSLSFHLKINSNFCRFRETIGQKVVSSLQRNDLAVTYAAIDMINSLMHSMNADYDLKQEQLNKSSLISSKNFLEKLLDMWTKHVVSLTENFFLFFFNSMAMRTVWWYANNNLIFRFAIPDSRQWRTSSVRNVRFLNFCTMRSL